jgi:GTPase SAR1 family protein
LSTIKYISKDLEKKQGSFKINTIGGSGSGKTSALESGLGRFKGLATSTIGLDVLSIFADFNTNNLSENALSLSNVSAKAIVWDLGGQTKYNEIKKNLFQGSFGQFGVVDGLNPKGVEILFYQLALAAQALEKHIPLYILVSKKDLSDKLVASDDISGSWVALNFLISELVASHVENFRIYEKNGELWVNYFEIEYQLISGLLHLTKKPIKIGEASYVNLNEEFGEENLRLIGRYLLLNLINGGKPTTLFRDEISKILQEIEWERPGRILPSQRHLEVRGKHLKKLQDEIKAQENLSDKPYMFEISLAIQSCLRGLSPVKELQGFLKRTSVQEIKQIIHFNTGSNLSEQQVRTVIDWVLKAKVFHNSVFNPKEIRIILVELIKEVKSGSETKSSDLDSLAKEVASDFGSLAASRRRGRRRR